MCSFRDIMMVHPKAGGHYSLVAGAIRDKLNITIVWNMTVCIFRVGCVDLYTDLTRGDSLELDLCIDLHNQRERYRLSYSILWYSFY